MAFFQSSRSKLKLTIPSSVKGELSWRFTHHISWPSTVSLMIAMRFVMGVSKVSFIDKKVCITNEHRVNKLFCVVGKKFVR